LASSSNIIQISSKTAFDICKAVAERVKSRRLELNLTQTGISARSGINIETYRKFERTGQISLQNLVKLAIALDMTTDFNSLFAQKQFQNLDDLLKAEKIKRKRGKRV